MLYTAFIQQLINPDLEVVSGKGRWVIMENIYVQTHL